MAGEGGFKTKLPPGSGRNTAVSGEDAVAVVPPVRIRNRVGIHVPVVAVPVDVHRTKRSRTGDHLCHCPLSTLGIVSYLGPKSPPVAGTNSCIF